MQKIINYKLNRNAFGFLSYAQQVFLYSDEIYLQVGERERKGRRPEKRGFLIVYDEFKKPLSVCVKKNIKFLLDCVIKSNVELPQPDLPVEGTLNDLVYGALCHFIDEINHKRRKVIVSKFVGSDRTFREEYCLI